MTKKIVHCLMTQGIYNMDAQLLKSKWKKLLKQDINSGFQSIRISAECLSNVYLGVDINHKHNLILALPDPHDVNITVFKKDKLTLELFKESSHLVLTLEDSNYIDLFDDLVISLYNSIKDISDVKIYSKVFMQMFFKWSHFFERSDCSKLSLDAIKGLWGELFVLRYLFTQTNPDEVNSVLNAWRGPYDCTHDFCLVNKNIEVKTKDNSISVVRISSEFQLEPEPGNQMELAVVSIIQDVISGSSLHDLVCEIKDHISQNLGDYSILLTALLQKGITLENLVEYDNYLFSATNYTVYDCLQINFPRLIESNLPASIMNVKYHINLKNVNEFIILKREY